MYNTPHDQQPMLAENRMFVLYFLFWFWGAGGMRADSHIGLASVHVHE